MITITINREDFLHELESVQPGLSPREIIEQSSCYIFKDGKVMTYNDEVACRRLSLLPLTGAVPAGPFTSILRAMVEETIEVEEENGELVLIGKKRKAGIRKEQEILLPVDKVEKPETAWVPLSEGFLEAISLVQHCASQDESQFNLTCISLTADHIEASDGIQAARVKIKTGVSTPFLVKRNSLKSIVSLGITEFAESPSWVHFRNPDGLVLSCRRYLEAFHDIAGQYNVKGSSITIPKGLGEAAKKAAIFSSDNSGEDNVVQIELRPNKLRLKGIGALGWFSEIKEIVYSGPEMSFQIRPELLIDITSKHNEAEITEGKMLIRGTNWRYITCLLAIGESLTPKDDEK